MSKLNNNTTLLNPSVHQHPLFPVPYTTLRDPLDSEVHYEQSERRPTGLVTDSESFKQKQKEYFREFSGYPKRFPPITPGHKFGTIETVVRILPFRCVNGRKV